MCFKLQLHILKHNLGKREQLKPPLPPPPTNAPVRMQ